MKRCLVSILLFLSAACWGSADPPAQPNPGERPEESSAVKQCKLTRSESKMVECIELGLYDPCDFGGGSNSWMLGQCAWGHAEVAERRLLKMETEITRRLANGRHDKVLADFRKAQRLWRESTDSYCRFTNEANESEAFEASEYYLSYGFCVRRFREQRVNELSPYITP